MILLIIIAKKDKYCFKWFLFYYLEEVLINKLVEIINNLTWNSGVWDCGKIFLQRQDYKNGVVE